MVIEYPHAVKVDGAYYAAHTPISVADATEHLRMGATLVEEENASEAGKTALNEEPKITRRGRKAKAE